jgi:hypothetical protein
MAFLLPEERMEGIHSTENDLDKRADKQQNLKEEEALR